MAKKNANKTRSFLNLPIANQIVIFDLEWTSWPGFPESGWSMPGKHREILQIGGVKLDFNRRFEEIDSFTLLVKPTINEKLSNYIQDLTGLTQNKIESEGIHVVDALHQFHEFCHKTDYLCYNGQDNLVLIENCRLNNIKCPGAFISGLNLQPILSSALKVSGKWITSGEIINHLNLPVTGKMHDALDDARSLATAIRYLSSN